ncbi:hypothetical protein ACFWUP_30220 [Nocardia sp. NPDC058658]|uniref:hypothetical protein n=1 Tax=Nocardia sp. NPDC058658 TaxID=3346580 RepID=UPI003654F8BC
MQWVRGDGLARTQLPEGYQVSTRHGHGPAPGGNEHPAPAPAVTGGVVVRAGNSPPHADGAFPPPRRPLTW